MKWDDEYIPEGWNKDNFKDYNNGEPDVVFMVYDPNTKKDNEIPYGPYACQRYKLFCSARIFTKAERYRLSAELL